MTLAGAEVDSLSARISYLVGDLHTRFWRLCVTALPPSLKLFSICKIFEFSSLLFPDLPVQRVASGEEVFSTGRGESYVDIQKTAC